MTNVMDIVSVEERHHNENSKNKANIFTFSHRLQTHKNTKTKYKTGNSTSFVFCILSTTRNDQSDQEQSDPPDEEFQNALKTILKILKNMEEGIHS